MSSSAPVALITGVSSAIGAATATHLMRSGFRVFGTSRNHQRLNSMLGVETLSLNIADSVGVRSVVQDILDRAGRIDVVVNNAGVGIFGAAEESSLAQARALFDTNFFGIISLTTEVLPHMRSRGSGRIINISSVLGFLPGPFAALYAASKHAVEGYTESLDHEVREFGVRAVLVEPGYTRTSFAANSDDPDRPEGVYAARRVAARALYRNKINNAELPDVVAAAVYTAATKERPKLRYPAGRMASRLTMLKRIAPAAILDRGIRKENQLLKPASR